MRGVLLDQDCVSTVIYQVPTRYLSGATQLFVEYCVQFRSVRTCCYLYLAGPKLIKVDLCIRRTLCTVPSRTLILSDETPSRAPCLDFISDAIFFTVYQTPYFLRSAPSLVASLFCQTFCTTDIYIRRLCR